MKKSIEKKLEEIKKLANNRDETEEDHHYECQVCHDKGLVYRDGKAYICQCMKRKKLEQQFKHARMTSKNSKKGFSAFHLDPYAKKPLKSQSKITYFNLASQCLQAARSFVQHINQGEKETKGMYIYGNVGSGKTLLASCIASELILKGHEVLFISVPDLLDELKDTFDNTESNEMRLMNGIRKAPVLIMDDLGAHSYTDWVAGRIYNIINYRAEQLLPTVITSNLSVSDLATYLDERTSSRILQLCVLYNLSVQEDIRRQFYKKNIGFDSKNNI